MQATVDLPEDLLREIETLARREGASAPELVRRVLEEHIARSQPVAVAQIDVHLPLIPASETGAIYDIRGVEIDALLSRDDFAA
jgi:hypothetical protein